DDDAAGTLTFDTSDADFTAGDEPSGKPEHYHVMTRWIPGVGGRGDATISGGDLEKWSLPSVEYTECWLPDGTLLYQDDNYTFIDPPVGTPEACTVREP